MSCVPFTGIAPVPSSSVVVNDVSGPTQNPSTLIIGIVAGLVGLLVITLLMIIIVLSLALVGRCKPAAVTKQNYVIPPQPPTQLEKIQLKENEAYENVLSDTSQPQVSIPPLQPNIAYGVVQIHQELRDEEDAPEYDIPLSSKHNIYFWGEQPSSKQVYYNSWFVATNNLIAVHFNNLDFEFVCMYHSLHVPW